MAQESLASKAYVDTSMPVVQTINVPQSSIPQWFSNLLGTFGGAASGMMGNMLGSMMGGLTDNLYVNTALGSLGSSVGSTLASSLISGKNLGTSLKNMNFSNMGFGLAGGLLGQAIGGDTGAAVGTAVSSIPTITLGIKGIQQTNAALNAGKTLTKAGKWALAGNIAGLTGVAASIADSFMPEKSEYSGDKGKVTSGLDTAYDLATAGVNFIPGVGLAISGAMAVGKLLGDGINAIGGGTDGMTVQDAILGSSFLNLTPLGMLNGFLGKNTLDYEKDLESFDQLRGSYTGSEDLADWSDEHADKKYGWFSNRARKKANRKIRNALDLQSRIGGIAEEAKHDLEMQKTMNPYFLHNVLNQMSGGVNYFLNAKLGAKLERARKTLQSTPWKADNWEATKLKEGGIIEQKTSDWKPEEWDSNPWLPELWSADSWKPEEWETIPEFKEGGKMNVIPEGALHARLHHMDLEGITKKGIPVITEEDGKVIQHAEIELNEIIFTLEVTLKIEELMKDGSDKAAIEAGKLLASEIIDNTDDRTGLILEINEN